MAEAGGFTVKSLTLSLESARNLAETICQRVSDLSTQNDPDGNPTSNPDAPCGSLCPAFNRLCVDIEECLATLRRGPPKHGAQPVSLDACPPVLSSFHAMAESLLPESLASLPVDAAANAVSRALWLQRTLSHALTWTESHEGLMLYLSFVPNEPPLDFLALEPPPAEVRRLRSSTRQRDSAQPNAKTVSYWLSVLNASFNNREPAEYHRERTFGELRNQATPDYPEAAVRWPSYAGRYWTTIRPQVFSLFNAEKSFNFVQWVLESARQNWPMTFGLEAPSAKPILDLTDALCCGRVLPIHAAAAFGLPNLCRDLISSGSPPDGGSPHGTPLTWSLLGPDAFPVVFGTVGWEPEAEPGPRYVSGRAETVRVFLDEGVKCDAEYGFLGPQPSTMAGLALWATLCTGDEGIMDIVRLYGCALDRSFPVMLQLPVLEAVGSQHRDVTSRQLVFLFDRVLVSTFSSHVDLLNDEWYDTLLTSIQGLMERLDMDFVTSGNAFEITDCDVRLVEGLAENAVRMTHAIALRRICQDPRLNVRASVVGHESLLHKAIADDSADIVDVLMAAGASLDSRDEEGRTPLMLVESPEMLAKMVLKYGATTTCTDDYGRNIWHYAAATNDIDLLTWLCQLDPYKSQNIDATSREGFTPLAEALNFIGELDKAPGSIWSDRLIPRPLAARRMLKELKERGGSAYLSFSPPPTHLAARWGDVELIEGLSSLGADFDERDKLGQSVFHHLNFSASPELVRRLLELCTLVELRSHEGLTPAEAVFRNVTSRIPDGCSIPTAHPAYAEPLSEDAYYLLLKEVVMKHPSYEPITFWNGFCAILFKETPKLDHAPYLPRPPVMEASVSTALRCAIKAGVLDDFESSLGMSAVCGFMLSQPWDVTIPYLDMRPSTDGNGSGPTTRAKFSANDFHVRWCSPHILAVLDNSAPAMADKFYSSEDARHLLIKAGCYGEPSLVRHLCTKGVAPFDKGDALSGLEADQKSPLEWAIGDCVDVKLVGEMLEHISAEDLNRGQRRIVRAFSRYARKNRPIVKMLLQKGMDPSFRVSEDGSLPMISLAAQQPTWVAEALLEHGVDARAGLPGQNAAAHAAKAGNNTFLFRVIRKYGRDFPWTDVWRGESGDDENILIATAMHGQMRTFEMLVNSDAWTGLADHVSDVVGGTTVTHIIARKLNFRFMDRLVRLAVSQHVDFTVQDSRGQTPLHVVCLSDEAPGYAKAMLWVLWKADARPLSMRDNEGKTPSDILRERATEYHVDFDLDFQDQLSLEGATDSEDLTDLD